MLKENITAITSEQMAEVDRLMIEAFHIDLAQMMENAGRHLATLAFSQLNVNKMDESINPQVSILIGPGHNGGGALTAARYLSNWGVSVTVILLQPVGKLRVVPKTRWQTLLRLPVRIAMWNEPDVLDILNASQLIIDGMLGYNQQGNPYGAIGEVINLVNLNSVMVLSLDVPSGLDATTGISGEPCLKSNMTLTLALPKTGLVNTSGSAYCGELYLADIGVPPVLYIHLGLSEQHLFKDNPILKFD